jgi:hypothetical protein
MSAIHLAPETVIDALKASLKNLIVKKPSADKKKGSTATFNNVYIKVKDKPQRLLIAVKTPLPINRGVPNPFDANDSRTTYLRNDSGGIRETLKAQFDLRDPVLREMVELLEQAYFAQLGNPEDDPELIDDAGRIRHTLYDTGRPVSHSDSRSKLLANPHATQPEFPYDCPRFSASIKFSKCSEKHIDAKRRGKPESEILDDSKPIIRNDRVVGAEPATVNGEPLNAANAYQFINDGAVFVAQRWEFSAIVVSTSYVSMPCVITWASVKTGDSTADDSEMFAGREVPATKPATPVETPPASPMPAAPPTEESGDDGF